MFLIVSVVIVIDSIGGIASVGVNVSAGAGFSVSVIVIVGVIVCFIANCREALGSTLWLAFLFGLVLAWGLEFGLPFGLVFVF